MKQGGDHLQYGELKHIMDTVSTNGGLWSGLAGIDEENTAPYFDDALETLVQTYGAWNAPDMDIEYNRRDLRDEAIRRALWAILVVQGYAGYGGERGLGTWHVFTPERERVLLERQQSRTEAYTELKGGVA